MTHTRIPVSIVVALLTGAAVLGGPASAGSSAHEQVQRFTLYSANIDNKDAPLLVQASGPITGVGSAKTKDDVPGTTIPLTFTFPSGKIFLTSHDDFNWKPDPRTCTATVHSTGTYTVTGGTGAFRGAGGHGTFVERGAGIGSRDSSGKCLQKFKLNYVIADLTGS
jgi:hypothetical protein